MPVNTLNDCRCIVASSVRKPVRQWFLWRGRCLLACRVFFNLNSSFSYLIFRKSYQIENARYPKNFVEIQCLIKFLNFNYSMKKESFTFTFEKNCILLNWVFWTIFRKILNFQFCFKHRNTGLWTINWNQFQKKLFKAESESRTILEYEIELQQGGEVGRWSGGRAWRLRCLSCND